MTLLKFFALKYSAVEIRSKLEALIGEETMETIAGMDSSENFKYIGIIVGNTNAIKNLYQRLKEKYGKLHMRDLYASKRKNLARVFKKRLSSSE